MTQDTDALPTLPAPTPRDITRLSDDELVGLAAALPHLLWSATRADGIEYLGPQWSQLAGTDLRRSWHEGGPGFVHPEDRASVRDAWLAATGSGLVQVRARLLGHDGVHRWFDIRGSRVGEGPSARWFGSCTDVSAEHEAIERLRLEHARWELLAESSPGVTIAFEPMHPDRDGTLRLAFLSGQCQSVLGCTPEEIVKDPEGFYQRFAAEDVDDMRLQMHTIASTLPMSPRTLEHDARFEHPTLGPRVLETRAAGAPMPDGSYRWQANVTDVTDRRAAEATLHAERERALVTLASIGDAVITTDADGLVTYLNPVAEDLTGWTAAEARGLAVDDVLQIYSEATGAPVESPARRCLREGRPVGLSHHTALRDRTGRSLSIEDSSAPIRDAQGEVLGAVLVFHDVSDTKAMTLALAHQASHDALTGLVNRTEFERRLNAALADARDGAPAAVLYLDLDQFKVVNDTDGHIAGDALLCALAGVLQAEVRSTDSVARLGGDEFGIILVDCPEDHALDIAEGLCTTVASERFEWEHRQHRIGVSIGLVSLDPDSGTAADVLRIADGACYLAKEAGRGRVHVAHGGDERARRRHGEISWVRRLREVIEHGDLVLWAQAILPARPGEEAPSVEILLRLTDESGRLAAPGEFLPAAERYQLAGALDRAVVGAALRWFAERPAVLDRIDCCSINLSAESIGDGETIPVIVGLLDELGLDGKHFCFEVTETTAIADLEDTGHFLGLLRARGCTVALDDFGVGLSSFGYLRTLPVDLLKIDGSFVRRVLQDPVDEVMVRSIHEVGHLLGKRTVAEYVEDDAIRTAVTAIGVDLVQGFGVGRPAPLDEVLRGLLGPDVPGLG